MRATVLVMACFLSMALSGCLSTRAQDDRQKQVIADLLVINSIQVTPSVDTRAASYNLAIELGNSFDIDIKDLPPPRVPKKEWIEDSAKAKISLDDQQESDGKPQNIAGLIGAGLGLAGMIALSFATKMPGGVGGVAQTIQSLLTFRNPKDDKLFIILTAAIDAYKQEDPNWSNNPLIRKISHIMPDSVKEHVKNRSLI